MFDFTKDNPNQLDPNRITLDITFGFLAFLCTEMKWMENTGQAALTKDPKNITWDEWHHLYNHSHLLFERLGRSGKVFSELHLSVVEKGIDTFIEWLTPKRVKVIKKNAEGCVEIEIFQKWSALIEGEVGKPARFGLGSHFCTKDVSWALVERMLPIAQKLKSEPWLNNIAKMRFQNDPEAEVLFAQQHKDW